MNYSEVTKIIPYSTIINIIKNSEERKTRDLIAFQYAFGCRAGELAKEYKHRYYRHSKRFDEQVFISKGIANKDFNIKSDNEISLLKPNFKQAKVKNRDKMITDISKFTTFILRDAEPYLFSLIYNRVVETPFNEPIFNLKESMIRKRIDKELKKYNSTYSSHWLRHSRAKHIALVTGDPMAVQSLLGHSDMNTTMRYISKLDIAFRKAVAGGKTVEDLLGKNIGGDNNDDRDDNISN